MRALLTPCLFDSRKFPDLSEPWRFTEHWWARNWFEQSMCNRKRWQIYVIYCFILLVAHFNYLFLVSQDCELSFSKACWLELFKGNIFDLQLKISVLYHSHPRYLIISFLCMILSYFLFFDILLLVFSFYNLPTL